MILSPSSPIGGVAGRRVGACRPLITMAWPALAAKKVYDSERGSSSGSSIQTQQVRRSESSLATGPLSIRSKMQGSPRISFTPSAFQASLGTFSMATLTWNHQVVSVGPPAERQGGGTQNFEK
jgi:hypothetical protein